MMKIERGTVCVCVIIFKLKGPKEEKKDRDKVGTEVI